MANGERILALDLGTTSGYFDGVEDPAVYTLDKTCRAIDLYQWLYGKIRVNGSQKRYDTIVIENAICQMAFANEVFLELKTIVKLLCAQHGIKMVQIAPTRIKKIFTGSGTAEKEDVIKKVLEMGLPLPNRILTRGKNKGNRVYDSNAADAVAVYHTYLTEQANATSH